jgi:hypothetical protein
MVEIFVNPALAENHLPRTTGRALHRAMTDRDPDGRRRFRAEWVVVAVLVATLAAWYLTRAGVDPTPPRATPPPDPRPPAPSAPRQPAPLAPPVAPASAPSDAADADAAAIHAAIARVAADAATCRSAEDPAGTAYVSVKVEAPGRVKYAKVTLDPYAGTATARCIEAKMLAASLPGFRGDELSFTQVVKLR